MLSSLFFRLLGPLGRATARWMERFDPWAPTIGVARSCLALGTLLTLAFNHPDLLFRPASGVPAEMVPNCIGLARWSLFCLLEDHLNLARWIAVAGLAVVISGWRPRWTGVLHWWICVSFSASAMVVDGGDTVAGVLALLLIPVTLTDRRRWHWSRPSLSHTHSSSDPPSETSPYMAWVALSALVAIRIQVSGIYLHAAVGKVAVPEWADGTAMYYWLTDPTFGAPQWLSGIVGPLLTQPLSVSLLTWGVIVLEFFLFAALVMPRRAWHIPLVCGLGLHLSIALIQGLVSFGCSMVAALLLYLATFETVSNDATETLGSETLPRRLTLRWRDRFSTASS